MDPWQRKKVLSWFKGTKEYNDALEEEEKNQKRRKERWFEDINDRLQLLIKHENTEGTLFPIRAVTFKGETQGVRSFDDIQLMPGSGEDFIALKKTARYYLLKKSQTRAFIQETLNQIETNKQNINWLYGHMDYATETRIDIVTGKRKLYLVVFYKIKDRLLQRRARQQAQKAKVEKRKRRKEPSKALEPYLESIPEPPGILESREPTISYAVNVFNDMRRGDFDKFKNDMRSRGRDDLARILTLMNMNVDEDNPNVWTAATEAVINVMGAGPVEDSSDDSGDSDDYYGPRLRF